MADNNLQGAVIEVRYVKLQSVALWDRNPKRHSLPALISTIERHGFRDAPIFDGALNGIAAGNGRIQALTAMQEMGKDVPVGVAVDDNGDWYVPVQFGVDADSVAAAEAFGVSHNNLTLAGGDFTAEEMARMWDGEGYLALLESLNDVGQMPDTVTIDDLAAIDAMLNPDPGPQEFPEFDEDLETEHVCPQCGYEWSGSA